MIDGGNIKFLPGCDPTETSGGLPEQSFKFEPSPRAVQRADQLNTGLRERILRESARTMLQATLESSLGNDAIVEAVQPKDQ